MRDGLLVAISDPAKVYRFAQKLRQIHGKWIGMPRIMEALEKNLESSDSDKANQELFVNNLFNLVDTTEQQLLSRHWRILEAPSGQEFVLSDTPTLTRIKFDNGFYGYGWGLATPRTEAVLPISPRLPYASESPAEKEHS
jgi:hypothetical protein